MIKMVAQIVSVALKSFNSIIYRLNYFCMLDAFWCVLKAYLNAVSLLNALPACIRARASC